MNPASHNPAVVLFPQPASSSLATASPRQRWEVVGAIVAVSFLTILARAGISGAKLEMAHDLGISDLGLGLVFGAFALGYAVFMVPCGLLADRWGPRKSLTLSVFFWSLFTLCTGLASGASVLIGIRFLSGLAEAGVYPQAARALHNWTLARERGLALGLLNMGSRLRAAFGLLTAPACVAWLGWRESFAFLGIIGAIWFWWFRDTPAIKLNKYNSETFSAGKENIRAASQIPWRAFLSSRFGPDTVQRDQVHKCLTSSHRISSQFSMIFHMLAGANHFGTLLVGTSSKGSKMQKFLCTVLLAFSPSISAWAATAPLKVLIFSKTAAYRHASIPAGIKAIEELGALHGWDVDATEDASQLNDDNLKHYDVVVWLNTSGDILDLRQKASYERFQQSHKGTVAIHEAGTDTEREGWPWYRKMASVLLNDHPEIQKATVLVQDQTHPASFALPLRWEHVDEWYSFISDPRLDPDVHVLASVDEETYDPGEFSMGKGARDHPITWYKHYDGGRYFYTSLGHTYEDYRSDRYFRALLTGAIEWAGGRAPDHPARDTDDAGLIFKEFDGKSPNGVWDRQGPPQPLDFKYAVKRDALAMYANTPLNQHLVREGVAIDPARPYAVEGKFVIPKLGDDANSFCVNLNVAGPDGDVSNVNTWSLNVDIHQEGGAVMKFMGFVKGRFTEIGQVETNWGAAGTEYSFRMYVNADYDGRYQSKRVSIFVMKGDTQLEKLMVDYSSFPYQPDGAKSVRLGVNTHNTDWVLRDLKVYYLDVPQRQK